MTSGMPVLGHDDMEPLPWPIIVPHAIQAQINHNQSLKRLAERGGLSPCEMLAVLEDRPWQKMDTAEAIGKIGSIIRDNTERLRKEITGD